MTFDGDQPRREPGVSLHLLGVAHYAQAQR
jgi:hypothetical protein